MILPTAVPQAPKILVMAPSSSSDLPRIEQAKQNLERMGLNVTLAPNIAHRHQTYLAGTDDERLEQLNAGFRNDSYDAFLFARGGYGAMRILDRIDYDAFARNPRPLIGFSDITALHQAIAVRCNIATFHGPMLNSDFHDGVSPSIGDWFWALLRGESPRTWPFDKPQVVCEGDAEGTLFGGCLSLTAALSGTPYDFWIDGGIWFWEDVDEPLYRLDRMLTTLRLSGRLRSIRGVIIGRLKGCGGEAELNTLLHEFFDSQGIPVVRDFPFGHFGDNLLMPIGANVRLSTRERSFTVTDPVVAR